MIIFKYNIYLIKFYLFIKKSQDINLYYYLNQRGKDRGRVKEK